MEKNSKARASKSAADPEKVKKTRAKTSDTPKKSTRNSQDFEEKETCIVKKSTGARKKSPSRASTSDSTRKAAAPKGRSSGARRKDSSSEEDISHIIDVNLLRSLDTEVKGSRKSTPVKKSVKEPPTRSSKSIEREEEGIERILYQLLNPYMLNLEDVNPKSLEKTTKRSTRSDKKYESLEKNERKKALDRNNRLFYEEADDYSNIYLKVLEDFQIPAENRRDGNYPKYYNYLLLDSRKYRKNLSWDSFINHIFYVGKGTGDRAYKHGKDAIKAFENNPQRYLSDDRGTKPDKIIDIWINGGSVLILIFSENIISEEAHTKEAAMIDVIGLQNLTNSYSGTYYGIASTFSARQKQQLGEAVLMEAKNVLAKQGFTNRQDPPHSLQIYSAAY